MYLNIKKYSKKYPWKGIIEKVTFKIYSLKGQYLREKYPCKSCRTGLGTYSTLVKRTCESVLTKYHKKTLAKLPWKSNFMFLKIYLFFRFVKQNLDSVHRRKRMILSMLRILRILRILIIRSLCILNPGKQLVC